MHVSAIGCERHQSERQTLSDSSPHCTLYQTGPLYLYIYIHTRKHRCVSVQEKPALTSPASGQGSRLDYSVISAMRRCASILVYLDVHTPSRHRLAPMLRRPRRSRHSTPEFRFPHQRSMPRPVLLPQLTEARRGDYRGGTPCSDRVSSNRHATWVLRRTL